MVYRLEELVNLARTAGAETVEKVTQDRKVPDSRLFVGKGTLERIRELVIQHSANLVIFWNDLSPSQERNVEDILGVKIVNRTELILDIFAQHAHTKEGSLQVEMAQTAYMLTRLVGRGVMMSRLGGGIGTRGPGETKLEMDRRRLRKRLADLKQELSRVARERQTQRELRRRAGIPMVAIVGYTNAGKSSLLRALTKADVLVQDQLFATLDPTVRRRRLPHGSEVLLVDTVGFVENLPPQLISAFEATLQEVRDADLLLHVVDAADPDRAEKIRTVQDMLQQIEAGDKGMITAFNKMDLLAKPMAKSALRKYRPAVSISAEKDLGLEDLLAEISKWARKRMKRVILRVPFSDAHIFSDIYRFGELIKQDVKKEAYHLDVRVPPELAASYAKYRLRRSYTAKRKKTAK